MSNHAYDIGNDPTHLTAGVELSSYSGASGFTCAGLDLLTCPSPPTLISQMNSVAYGSSTYTFPVPNGTYHIYIIAYDGDATSNRARTCIVDGVTKFSAWQPYTDAGNTLKAAQKKISSYTVTGNSVIVELTATGGAGYDTWGYVVFEDTADSAPPTIEIDSPSDGDTVTGTIAFEGVCADNIAVVGVQLKKDGVSWGSEFTGSGITSFSISRDVTALDNGDYEITAVARDAVGNTTESDSITITVNNPSDDFHWDSPQLPEFYQAFEPDLDVITKTHPYDDGGESQNELADTGPRSWALTYAPINRDTDGAAMRTHLATYRKANAFNFIAKDGNTYVVKYVSFDTTYVKENLSQTQRIKIVLKEVI